MSKNLDMTHLANEPEAEEVCENFRDVVNNRSNSKKSWRASVILKMPKKESENEPYSKTHEPSNK